LICLGFFLGGLIAEKIAANLSNVLLEKVFGIALKMIFSHSTQGDKGFS
jgi:hypothetical protein